MKGRDNLIKALTSGTEIFPVVIPYLRIFLRDHWDEITHKPWWAIWFPEKIIEVDEDLHRKLDIDWASCKLCPTREWRKRHKVECYDKKTFLVDTEKGEKIEIKRPPVGGWVTPIDFNPRIRSEKDLDRIEIPSSRRLIKSGQLDYACMVKSKFGSSKFVFASVGSPFWRALSRYMGLRGTLLGLIRKPSLIKSVIKLVTQQVLEEVRAYSKVGVDGIWVEDCLTSADEISVKHFKKFVLPFVEDVIQEIESVKMKSIYHFCGDVHDRLDLLVKTGCDAIALEESKKSFRIDLDWVSNVVAGRCCVFGNLDSVKVLQDGTRDDLKRELERQIMIGRRHGKFVVSLGSPVTPLTPLRKVVEYVRISRELTRI